MKLALIIIAVALIPLGYSICECVYPGESNIKLWWMLRIDLYVSMVALLFISNEIKTSKKMEAWCGLFMFLGSGLVLSDIYDRRCLDLRVFTPTDIVMVLATLFFGIRQYFRFFYDYYLGWIDSGLRFFLHLLKNLFLHLLKKTVLNPINYVFFRKRD